MLDINLKLPFLFPVMSYRFCVVLISAMSLLFGRMYVWRSISQLNMLIWKSPRDRLPTLAGLIRHNIPSEPGICKICSEGIEDTDHLLTACSVLIAIWQFVSR
ncbi:putative reverse transcriptase zinc-binding domain-containing protein [Helianthus anomalus]